MSRPIRMNKEDWQDTKEKRTQRKREKGFRDERKKRRNRWQERKDLV